METTLQHSRPPPPSVPESCRLCQAGVCRSPLHFCFGDELSSHTCSFTFKAEEEDKVGHVLALTVLCLMEEPKISVM